ncbi:MAG: flagellar hook-length control protein FliK, partial [Burkholderiaceae bacterium]
GSTGQVNGLPPRSEKLSSPISVSSGQVDKSIKDLPLLQFAPALNPGHLVRLMSPLAATPTPTPTPTSTSTSTAAQDLVALGAAPPIIANSNFASWMPLKASTWVDASTVADTNAASSEVAIQDAVRLTIIPPNQVVTKRLAQMSGNSEPNTWTTLLAGNTIPASTLATVKEWETLQLDIPDDLLLTLLDRPQEPPVSDSFDNSASSPRLGEAMAIASPSASHHAKSEPTNLPAQVEQRFIQQQQLADKLAQALAQRLVGQMERGQWKIQMRLQPENLGQIDVELKLHAGGLDALFSAENPLTRELITQGSGKLKDSLTQAGMAVASVWVNGDQNRQSGGNSTPWNSFNATASVATGKPDSVEEVVASEKGGAAVTDGLNIWA